jgi:hypothetical protein
MGRVCREFQEWIEEEIEQPIEEDRQERRCRRRRCNWWCLCARFACRCKAVLRQMNNETNLAGELGLWKSWPVCKMQFIESNRLLTRIDSDIAQFSNCN